MQTPTDDERLARLRLARTPTIGPVTYAALLDHFGTATAAIDALPALARRSRAGRSLNLVTAAAAARELDAVHACGAILVTAGEPAYPRLLREIDPPPPVITMKGKLSLLQAGIVAIVGARNASALGQRMAREMAASLGAAGFTVASGMARGIDTAAHHGSLATGSVAIMAGGIDIIYPPENRNLHARLASEGVLVAEMPPGFQPTAAHFPRRNRIISGLARGVVVVEASLNSGSLITARLAGEQGREVFAVPGSPLDPRAQGPNSLLRQGATLAESADDVIAALQDMPAAPPPPRSRAGTVPDHPPPGADLQQRILACLGPAPVETDDLVRLLEANPARVAAALLELEFAGLLTRHPGQAVSLGPSC